ncbi:TetR/AcrR family transcriptional regulator C-terminal domain-containing protein [Actinocrispum wychmicini]|uniref:TetR/AcrR family transcriptional regulator C-terminal domain-containing protein n=1 Tax=Actinocrispum wychmicini TaxID=1213861 RepID=UPI001049044E|nr:TetR/AcrR family transcriptional regulator C-terminal domain-containing protein [Actinocrispum wychmicini]
MKLSPEVIAEAGLRLLNEVGLDGLTMRLVAKDLGVQASALYWHVKGKQELLDEMATIMVLRRNESLELPGRGVSWDDWVVDGAFGFRRAMLAYRDGGKVVAGTNITHPVIHRTTELTLRALQDADFPLVYVARTYPVVYHYTVGFTIEEQARHGSDYAENPYNLDKQVAKIDVQRFPLTASMLPHLFEDDADSAFEHGLRTILLGMKAGAPG